MAKVKIYSIKATKRVSSSMPYYIKPDYSFCLFLGGKALRGVSYYYIKLLYWKYTKFLRARSGDTLALYNLANYSQLCNKALISDGLNICRFYYR